MNLDLNNRHKKTVVDTILSDIPFIIDISDYTSLDEDFKKMVLEKGIELK